VAPLLHPTMHPDLERAPLTSNFTASPVAADSSPEGAANSTIAGATTGGSGMLAASSGGLVQRVPNQTRIDRLSASILRKALRWLAGRHTNELRGYKQVIYQAAVAVDPADPQRTVEAFIRVTLEVETVTTRNVAPAPDTVFPSLSTFSEAERRELIAAAAKQAANARLMTAQQASLPGARTVGGAA